MMPIRALIATLLLCACTDAWSEDAVRQLIERGSWKEAQLKVYDRAWARHPAPEILISMGCSGFVEQALQRAKGRPAITRSYVLTGIATKGRRLSLAQRVDILGQALHATTDPDQRVSVAVGWLELGEPTRAIAMTRSALREAQGSSAYTRRMLDTLVFTQNAPLATALARDLVTFAHAVPGDQDPYVYIDLARLMALAGDEKGLQTALHDAAQRVAHLPQGQQPSALTGMVDVALRSNQPTLAARLTPRQNVVMEWAGFYARHADYKQAEALTEGMSDTLYVSHRQESLANTIGEAVHNGDLNSASEMTERLIKVNDAYAALQRLIGNAHGAAHQQAEAAKAYAKGAARYLRLDASYYSQSDVKVLAQLSLAARRSGQPKIADIVMGFMPTLVAKQYPKDLKSQVMSRVYFATLLIERGERKAASISLAQANELLSTTPDAEKKLGFTELELGLADGLGDAIDVQFTSP